MYRVRALHLPKPLWSRVYRFSFKPIKISYLQGFGFMVYWKLDSACTTVRRKATEKEEGETIVLCYLPTAVSDTGCLRRGQQIIVCDVLKLTTLSASLYVKHEKRRGCFLLSLWIPYERWYTMRLKETVKPIEGEWNKVLPNTATQNQNFFLSLKL